MQSLLATAATLLLLARFFGEILGIMPPHLIFILMVLISNCVLSSDCQFAMAAADTISPVNNEVSPPKLLLKPGEAISIGMQTEDIVATYDVNLAKQQVAVYPDSPEASFVLAVALTRTSMVEEALREVRKARKLAENKGGPAYFDHMIGEYEDMLKSYPNDNRVRYGLAWAYYMKAYVLTHYAQSIAKTNSNIQVNQTGNLAPKANWHNSWAESLSQSSDSVTNSSTEKNKTSYQSKNDWKNVPPQLVPQVKGYYECALSKLDELLAREPNDIWAKSYRAFLYAEYTGDLQEAMSAWQNCLSLAPNNPAAYFFLGESYLQQGNLKECLHNISKAVALRALPN